MKRLQLHLPIAAAVVVGLIPLAACHNKHLATPAPPVAAARTPAPTASITADRTAIQRGESSTISWSTQNASTVELNGAVVAATGSQTVSPQESTSYELVATNRSAKANAGVRITVTEPAAPVAAAAPAQEDLSQLWAIDVKDGFFDYDKAVIRQDAQKSLTADADFLKGHPNLSIIIEGHCDERGSAEYNMGLGDRRANAIRDYLVAMGVDGSRIRTISYGKEKPFCTDHSETCWQENRRGHFVQGGK